MNKKWLALGLAAMMSFACLTACGDNGDNNGNNDNNDEGNNVIKGEQVTAEQWMTAFENIDFTYAVTEERVYNREDFDGGTWEDNRIEKEIYNDGEYYYYEYDCENAILGVTEGEISIEEEWRRKEEDGTCVYYKTGEDIGGEVIWHLGSFSSRHVLDKDDVQSCMQDIMDENVILNYDESVFEQEIEEFTFDTTTGVYHQDWQEVENDEEEKAVFKERLEVMFIDGKVYSIKGIYTEEYICDDGETEYWESTYTVTFKKEEIVMPS